MTTIEQYNLPFFLCLCLVITSSLAIPIFQSFRPSDRLFSAESLRHYTLVSKSSTSDQLLSRSTHPSQTTLRSFQLPADHANGYPFILRQPAKNSDTAASPKVTITQSIPQSSESAPVASSSPSPALKKGEDGDKTSPKNSNSGNTYPPSSTPLPDSSADGGYSNGNKKGKPSYEPSPIPIVSNSNPSEGNNQKGNLGPSQSNSSIAPTPSGNAKKNTGAGPQTGGDEHGNGNGKDDKDIGGDDDSKNKNDPSLSSPKFSPISLTSSRFLIGIGIVLIVASATYSFFRSGICGGLRRSVTEQPYESVNQEDSNTFQRSQAVAGSNEVADADGWNDGWENDDWGASESQTKD